VLIGRGEMGGMELAGKGGSTEGSEREEEDALSSR